MPALLQPLQIGHTPLDVFLFSFFDTIGDRMVCVLLENWLFQMTYNLGNCMPPFAHVQRWACWGPKEAQPISSRLDVRTCIQKYTFELIYACLKQVSSSACFLSDVHVASRTCVHGGKSDTMGPICMQSLLSYAVNLFQRQQQVGVFQRVRCEQLIYRRKHIRLRWITEYISSTLRPSQSFKCIGSSMLVMVSLAGQNGDTETYSCCCQKDQF
ncbi:hypothetical protein GGI35DRAFT_73105 [Trichoderma velutinum]